MCAYYCIHTRVRAISRTSFRSDLETLPSGTLNLKINSIESFWFYGAAYGRPR